MNRLSNLRSYSFLLVVGIAPLALAQTPGWNSLDPTKAKYTVYLDFDGFTYPGQWAGYTPGTTPAFAGTDSMKKAVWAHVAEQYAAWNINVSTVDPFKVAGLTGDDTVRKNFYDNTPKVMHTVVGSTLRGNNYWVYAGGISYVGVISGSQPGTGYHTNWVFPNLLGGEGAGHNIGTATTHENGHAFGLWHQTDPNQGNTQYSTNNGNSAFAPIMGVGYDAKRALWRDGQATDGSTSGGKYITFAQNDVKVLQQNDELNLLDDGIGHSFATASTLAVSSGGDVLSSLAKGVLTAASEDNPDPIGVNSYTKDYFAFKKTYGGAVSLNLMDGGQWITEGVAAEGAQFRGNFRIYRQGDLNALYTGTEAADTMSSSWSGHLDAGSYYLEVFDYGGMISTFDRTARYYTQGSYFLTGTGIDAVPEPASLVALALGSLAVIRRRKSRSR